MGAAGATLVTSSKAGKTGAKAGRPEQQVQKPAGQA